MNTRNHRITLEKIRDNRDELIDQINKYTASQCRQIIPMNKLYYYRLLRFIFLVGNEVFGQCCVSMIHVAYIISPTCTELFDIILPDYPLGCTTTSLQLLMLLVFDIIN